MAWIVGYVSLREYDELRARGWDVERAEKYKLIGNDCLLEGPKNGDTAVAIWVDTDVMQVFNGPEWDGAGESDEARQLLDRLAKLNLDLDEQVHEAKAQEASSINNAGIEAQLSYLLRYGGLEWLREYFSPDLNDGGLGKS
jgi:hypothetical protein